MFVEFGIPCPCSACCNYSCTEKVGEGGEFSECESFRRYISSPSFFAVVPDVDFAVSMVDAFLRICGSVGISTDGFEFKLNGEFHVHHD